ncbi:MAG: hypothetical protein ABI411_18685 [Tahibacter sp.]
MSECKTPADTEAPYTQLLQPEHGTAFQRFTDCTRGRIASPRRCGAVATQRSGHADDIGRPLIEADGDGLTTREFGIGSNAPFKLRSTWMRFPVEVTLGSGER